MNAGQIFRASLVAIGWLLAGAIGGMLAGFLLFFGYAAITEADFVGVGMVALFIVPLMMFLGMVAGFFRVVDSLPHRVASKI